LSSVRGIAFICWIVFAWFAFSILGIKNHQIDRPPISQVGCMSSDEKKRMPHGIANVAMPANWRIGPLDVAWPSKETPLNLTGRYTACKVGAGDPIVELEVASEPVYTITAGKVTYLLKSDAVSRSGISSSLNAEVRVQIFGVAGVPVVDDARVLAMICSDQCSVVLEMTSAERQLLMREDQVQIKLALRM
jgi:hypothetical protein